jgi:hypothetical protein
MHTPGGAALNSSLKDPIYGEHIRRGDRVLCGNIALYRVRLFFKVISCPPFSLGDEGDKTGAWKNYLESLVLT